MRVCFLILLILTPLISLADPFQITLEKWHHEALNYKRDGAQLDQSVVLRELQTPLLKDKTDIALNIQDSKKDLVVLIPGLFGRYDSPENARIAQLIYAKGYNIMRVSNPVSSHFIKLSPLYSPMDFESESKVIVDLIQQVQAEYGFPRIHLVGTSYGAFIAAVTSVQMGEEFNGHLKLVSPPKNILTSLQKVDSYFDEMQKDFDRFPWSQILFYINEKWALLTKKEIHLTPEVAKETLIIYGFHKTFLSLTDLKDPKPWYRFYEKWLPATRQKNNEMRFISYLNKANPDFFKTPEKHEVLYWAQKSGRPWSLMTSDDDFINASNPWPNLPQIQIFSSAGHVFGYFENPSFLTPITTFP